MSESEPVKTRKSTKNADGTEKPATTRRPRTRKTAEDGGEAAPKKRGRVRLPASALAGTAPNGAEFRPGEDLLAAVEAPKAETEAKPAAAESVAQAPAAKEPVVQPELSFEAPAAPEPAPTLAPAPVELEAAPVIPASSPAAYLAAAAAATNTPSPARPLPIEERQAAREAQNQNQGQNQGQPQMQGQGLPGQGQRLSRRERWRLEREMRRQQHRNGGQGGQNMQGQGMPGGQPQGGRFGRVLTPEEQAAREAQREAARLAAEEAAAERARLALPLRLNDLQSMPTPKLKMLAEHFKIDTTGQRKNDLIHEILRQNMRCGGTLSARGVVELVKDYGFLRSPDNNYVASQDDVYVPQQVVRRAGLRTGDMVSAELRPPQNKERFFAVNRLVKINGRDADEPRDELEPFESQRPVYPDERLRLEVQSRNNVNMRVMDLLTPIGKGQRGLIVAPPRTGKTVLLQMIANSISENNPEVKLIILLIDERPEEVTDMQRNTKAEVISSTFDEAPERHAQVSELVIEMAKRQVEAGKDVVILLDSITRLARAYNTCAPHSGKILSGGIDANAMHKPKRFFGAARNIEGGGSLTIIATALIDTGSRMDEVIFEEFKGTGNMELNLDRALVDKRIFPAINIEKSGTRKEELLFHPDELNRIWILRKALNGIPPVEAMELLVGRLKKTGSNAEFLMTMKG